MQMITADEGKGGLSREGLSVSRHRDGFQPPSLRPFFSFLRGTYRAPLSHMMSHADNITVSVGFAYIPNRRKYYI